MTLNLPYLLYAVLRMETRIAKEKARLERRSSWDIVPAVTDMVLEQRLQKCGLYVMGLMHQPTVLAV